ncbi:CCR4-NOT transcription complex subunit 10 isoform X2 [Aplysia californica]|uniref:CCR4-NOT transcription complex subunit 10 n=1 Tax=Aplysia californica TaxID=6500 RepID=A0ABM1A6D6_APLCA|nr:CCR4-NOT transcription complex subunit 10 isoform X2 [Aplysia californica]
MASMDADRGSDDTRRQAPVTDQHRELANQAMQEFEKGHYNQCTNTMSRLGDARATDVKVVLNRSVALFYQSNSKAIDEFRHNIQTVFNMARISPDLSEKSNLDDADYAVVYYNKAVLLYHEKQHRAALSILEKLFRYVEPIDEGLAQKVMLLLTELYLTVHQPYDALNMVQNIEKFLTGKSQNSQDKDKNESNNAAAQEALRAKLTLYKVRCNLMAKQLINKKEFKTLSGNSHPVNFAKAYHMYLRGNAKKASKMLGNPPSVQLSPSSGECLALMYTNNQALLNMALRRPSLAVCQLRDALHYNEKNSRDTVPNDKAKPPLPLSYVSQHYILLHNLGVLQLHSKQPAAAFECFVECVQVYHRNPRLWLRLAECCIMHHKEVGCRSRAAFRSNDGDREHRHKLEVVQDSIGSGFHHKLVLGQGTLSDKKSTPSSGVFPNLNLGFASFCLQNARSLLPTDPQDVEPPAQDEQSEFSPPLADPVLVSAEPCNPLRETEVANLRCSILAASAYVALCENEHYKALTFSVDLLRQPNLSPAQRYLGHMYKGEALVALDRIADGVDELNPENVTDVSTTLPEASTEQEKDQEGLAETREAIVPWSPSSVGVARALMQYNLAVAYSMRTEYGRALKALTESSERIGIPYPVQMFYLKLYLDLKQGNKKGAISLINEHFGYNSRT